MTTINRKSGVGKVLVVDDDDTVRLLSSSALADAGFEVVTARNGSEALAAIGSGTVDCIVTDVHMPGIDGFELCSRVRSMPGTERVQVLVMTGSDDYAAIERAYDVGANDFFLKHSNPAMLVERVRFVFRAQHMQDALRVSEQRLLYAQRLAVLGHWERTLDGRTVAVSPVVCSLLGIEDATQLTWEMLCELSDPDGLAAMQKTLARAIAQRTTFRLEHRVCTRQGNSLALLHHGEVVLGANGEWVIRSTVQDVTEARAQEERIRFLAFHDPLTALPNRESATRSLGTIISQGVSAAEHVAVVALWLDDFNRISSSLGQSVSDAVLKTIGMRLRSTVRESDQVVHADVPRGGGNVVARTEGDKFLCVIGNLEHGESAIGIAQRLQHAVSSPLQMGDTELALSASVGISIFPEDGKSEDQLIERAFQALAHTAGKKGACQFFASEISSRARMRLTLEAELRRAVEAGEFELHFQPRMFLGDRSVRGAEALIRWRHPERGLVLPGQFISLAEDAGLIVPLGRLVIDMVARQAASWRTKFGNDFRVSFNISPLQFGVSDLVADIDRAVQRERAWHDNLEAEITESALMSRPEQVVSVLQELRERGLRLALDDFGTGFSSLSYLRKLPLDVLKIDRSFVADIGVTASGSSLVNAILYMSHALGMTCIAEGVEYQAQLNFLVANHCHEVQGYLLAKPMRVPEFERWQHSWSSNAARHQAPLIA